MFTATILAWVVAQGASAMANALAVREASGFEEPSPMRKVVHLLEDMKKELEKEAENEVIIFDKAMCMCETGERNLTKVIEDATSQIAEATAKIAAESAEHSKLKKELAVHESEKVEAEAALEKGAEVRASEKKKFVADETESVNSIAQLDGAVTALSKDNRDTALVQMTSLVMKVKHYLKEADHQRMLSFLGTRLGARAGSPGSEAILGILKSLNEEMSADLASVRETEQKANDEYLAMKNEKERQVYAAMQFLRDKEQRKGQLALSLQETQDSLEDAQDELEKAQSYLAALNEQCSRKQKDRAMRNEARNEELVALGEAMKVMNDDEAQESVNKVLPGSSLLQRKQHASAPVSLPLWEMDFSFVQTAASSQSAAEASAGPDESWHAGQGREVYEAGEKKIEGSINAYKEEAGIEDFKSTEKSRAAVKAVIAKNKKERAKKWKGEKPVNRIVRGIVDDMSYGLHKKDVEDEIQYEYCTKEIAMNEQLQKDKQAKSDVLTSKVEKMAATIEPLESEIALLKESINAQDQQVLDWTAQRKKEHDEFSTDYTNMAQAMKYIKKGMQILEKFYRPSLLQRTGASRQHQKYMDALGETAWQRQHNIHNMEQKLMPDDWFERDDSMAQVRKHQQKSSKKSSIHRHEEVQEAEIHRMEEKLAPNWDDDSLLQVRTAKRRVDPIALPDTPTTYVKKESGGVIGLMQQMITELKVETREAEAEENQAAIDYQKIMADAKMSREADMKSLTDKKVVLARNKEQLNQDQDELDLVNKELKNLEIVLIGLHHECDFIAQNYPSQHKARVDQDVSAKEIFNLIKHPIPSKQEIEQQFENEKTMKDVADNYPNQTKTD